jgi:two-component system invasion response regulator UvrY
MRIAGGDQAMINVMIADDHILLRRGIRSILDATSDMRIIEEAGDSAELVEKLSQKKEIQILLLDITMPGRSGIDMIQQIRSIRPDLRIIILSGHEDEQYAIRALKTGCNGYVIKSGSPEELIDAIGKVANGEKYISQKVAEELANYISRGEKGQPHESLSNREYDILCLIAQGKSMSEIGGSLNLSLKTVSMYKMSICKKLSCKNEAELTRYALEHSLI